MADIADRYRRVAARFTETATAVADEAWEAPAPCEGWVARDVVRHLTDWLPAFFFATWDLEAAPVPSVDDDPVAAWSSVDRSFQAALDDPEVATRVRDTPMGPSTLEDAFATIALTDVLLHTWDLARATGLDERLDPDEVHRMLAAAEPMDEAMRTSGHFGPRVPVPDDADEQTRLIAFTGRRP